MKKLMFIVLSAISACTTKPDKTVDETSNRVPLSEETAREPSTQILCFQRLEGTSNQDTTNLRLEITGDQVSGQLVHYPFEKDRRTGNIAAIRQGDTIKGKWFFMQEGVNDTLDVEFLLHDNELVQKSYSVSPETGRQILSAESRFELKFDRIEECAD